MNLLTTLSSCAGLFNRLLDKWDQYDKRRKQQAREKRRANVAAAPTSAFTQLFGDPDVVPNDTTTDPVRPDAATTSVAQDE